MCSATNEDVASTDTLAEKPVATHIDHFMAMVSCQAVADWDTAVAELFSPSATAQAQSTEDPAKRRSKRTTSHRLMTSEDVIAVERRLQEEQVRKEEGKEERQRKRLQKEYTRKKPESQK